MGLGKHASVLRGIDFHLALEEVLRDNSVEVLLEFHSCKTSYYLHVIIGDYFLVDGLAFSKVIEYAHKDLQSLYLLAEFLDD